MTPEGHAAEVLARYEVTSVPVPVDDIVHALKFSVGTQRHKGPEWGFVLRAEPRDIIGVNINTSRWRQRGSLAHSLGHALMHEGDLIVCHAVRLRTRGLPKAATDAEEAEASAFAVALLMSPEAFAAAVDEFATGRPEGENPPPRDELIDWLAKKFGASPEAVVFRLVSFGLLAV